MKKAAIYCRVSTEDQGKEGTSLQTQLDACQGYCKAKGYEILYQYTEAYSGLTLERPKLSELRSLIRDGKVEALVVYCLDRLSRDPVHGVIVIEELDKHQVTLEAVTETIDSSEVGKLISYIRGFASKLEAEKIKERTVRGKRAHVEMGKLPTGTGKGLYGYRWDRDSKKRTPVEYEVKIVRRIFAMLAGGSGYFNIARTLNEQGVPTKTGAKWCPRTIYSMAGNPAYIGMTYYYRTHGSRKTKLVKNPESEWALLPETTPAIISKEVFDRVQEIRQQNRELHQAKTTHDYLLRGHVRCGYCGAPLVGSCLSHSFRYYHCRATYPTAARLKTCNARYIRADNLENIVWENIRKALEQPEVVLAGVKEQLDTENNSAVQGLSVDNEIGKLTKQAKKYAAEEKRLIQLIRYGELNRDLVLDEINRLKAEREANDRKLNELSAAKEKIASLEKAEVKLEECCQKLRSHLDNATYQEKREILDMLAIKVTATPDSIKIEGVIPIETTPSENALASVEATHHWTNMGITTWT